MKKYSNQRHRWSAAAWTLAGALWVGTAQAIPMHPPVIQWAYELTSDWTAAELTDGTTPTTPTDTLTWGTGGTSSLSIGGDPASGNVNTWFGVGPLSFGLGNTLIHTNNPIDPPFLETATLTTMLTLTPLLPVPPGGGGPIPSVMIPFDISFSETGNTAPCADPTSPTPCNDIFVINGNFQNFPVELDDRTYLVNIFPVLGGSMDPIVPLPPTICGAVGRPGPCLGFTTPEQRQTTVQFGFSVSSQVLQVPEPGTLAILGLGLLGLGARRWRLSVVRQGAGV